MTFAKNTTLNDLNSKQQIKKAPPRILKERRRCSKEGHRNAQTFLRRRFESGQLRHELLAVDDETLQRASSDLSLIVFGQ